MAFVPGFDEDIFISYSHDNNDRKYGNNLAWVDHFHNVLDATINEIANKEVKLWRDLKVNASNNFDQKIIGALNSSAFFIALNSNKYSSSNYCQKEVKHFFKKCEEGPLGVNFGIRNENRRIINVLINKIDHQNWREEFSGATSYNFFNPDRVIFPVAPDTGEFRDVIEAIAADLLESMTIMSAEIQEKNLQFNSEKQYQSVVKETKKVFISTVCDDLRPTQDQVSRWIDKAGYEVIKDIPPPFESAGHESKVTALIEECAASIHLLNGNPGTKIKEDENYFTQKQLQLALSSKLPQIIWTPSNINLNAIQPDSYRSIFSELESSDRKEDIQFIRGLEADLEHDIIPELDTIYETLRQNSISEEEDKEVKILIERHSKDEQEVDKLINLSTNSQVLPIIRHQQTIPGQIQKTLEELLQEVKSVVFFRNNVTPTWIMKRLEHFLKMRQNHKLSFESCAICSFDGNLETPVMPYSQIPIIPIDSTQAFTDFLTKLRKR